MAGEGPRARQIPGGGCLMHLSLASGRSEIKQAAPRGTNATVSVECRPTTARSMSTAKHRNGVGQFSRERALAIDDFEMLAVAEKSR